MHGVCCLRQVSTIRLKEEVPTLILSLSLSPSLDPGPDPDPDPNPNPTPTPTPNQVHMATLLAEKKIEARRIAPNKSKV